MNFGAYGPLIGAAIITLSSPVVAIGVYEIVRHRDFQAFVATPLGKVASALITGGLMAFVVMNVQGEGGSFVDTVQEQVQGSYWDAIKSQVQQSYSEAIWSYLESQSSSVIAAGMAGIVGIAALLFNYYID